MKTNSGRTTLLTISAMLRLWATILTLSLHPKWSQVRVSFCWSQMLESSAINCLAPHERTQFTREGGWHWERRVLTCKETVKGCEQNAKQYKLKRMKRKEWTKAHFDESIKPTDRTSHSWMMKQQRKCYFQRNSAKVQHWLLIMKPWIKMAASSRL